MTRTSDDSAADTASTCGMMSDEATIGQANLGLNGMEAEKDDLPPFVAEDIHKAFAYAVCESWVFPPIQSSPLSLSKAGRI